MTAIDTTMISDRLFVYGTLMRGFDHPMAKTACRAAPIFWAKRNAVAGFISSSIIPGWCCRMTSSDIVFGELYRLRAARDELLGEFDMYESLRPPAFPSRRKYLRCMLNVTLSDGSAGEAWTYVL